MFNVLNISNLKIVQPNFMFVKILLKIVINNK